MEPPELGGVLGLASMLNWLWEGMKGAYGMDWLDGLHATPLPDGEALIERDDCWRNTQPFTKFEGGLPNHGPETADDSMNLNYGGTD